MVNHNYRIDPRRYPTIPDAVEEEDEVEEEEEQDDTPVRVLFNINEYTTGTASYRIDVPQYVVDEGQDAIRRYIRDNREHAEHRDTDTYDYNPDWDTIDDIEPQ
jgi:hypothetical protein